MPFGINLNTIWFTKNAICPLATGFNVVLYMYVVLRFQLFYSCKSRNIPDSLKLWNVTILQIKVLNDCAKKDQIFPVLSQYGHLKCCLIWPSLIVWIHQSFFPATGISFYPPNNLTPRFIIIILGFMSMDKHQFIFDNKKVFNYKFTAIMWKSPRSDGYHCGVKGSFQQYPLYSIACIQGAEMTPLYNKTCLQGTPR